MDVIEVLKLSADELNDKNTDKGKRELLRLVHSLYYLGLSKKLWIFRRPKVWQDQYKFAEDLAKVVQLVLSRKAGDEEEGGIYLSSSYFQTRRMRKILKVHHLLDRKFEASLEDLLLEQVVAPNEIFLYAVVVADMLLAERRKYTIQFWTTFFIGVLSVVATIVVALIQLR